MLTQFNTGSFFRASSAPSDFTLVELDDPIDPSFNVYWSGWDRTPYSAPGGPGNGDWSSATCIHHPNTDEKRITFSYTATTTTSYNNPAVPGDGTHIHAFWEPGLGVTEPGSSGSPLFNQDMRIVGQLHGGPSSCAATGANRSDYYGRFSVSWNGGGTATTRLKDWLASDDPNNAPLFIDGKNAVPFSVSATPLVQDVCAPADAQFTVDVQPRPSTDPVQLDVSGFPAQTTASFGVNPVTPPGTSVLTISGTDQAAPGSYALQITGTGDPGDTDTRTAQLNLSTGLPSVPPLTLPADGAVDVAVSPTLSWSASDQASSYTVEVATDSGFTNVVRSAADLRMTSYQVTPALDPDTAYFWRVRASNGCGLADATSAFQFHTANVVCRSPALAIPDNTAAGVDDSTTVSSGLTLSDLNISILATHSWVGDLKLTVRHVQTGTSVVIIDRPGVPATTNGCSGDNIDAVLDDQASSPVETQCSGTPPAISGTFQPNNPLSAFNGQSLDGTWTLNVADLAGQDTGTLVQWCLVPSGTTGDTPTPGPTGTPTRSPTTTTTPTPTATRTETATRTATRSRTPTRTRTPTPTRTATGQPFETATAVPSDTPTPSATSVPTDSPTLAPTSTHTQAPATRTPQAPPPTSVTSTATATPPPTATRTPAPSSVPSDRPGSLGLGLALVLLAGVLSIPRRAGSRLSG